MALILVIGAFPKKASAVYGDTLMFIRQIETAYKHCMKQCEDENSSRKKSCQDECLRVFNVTANWYRKQDGSPLEETVKDKETLNKIYENLGYKKD